MRHFDLVVVIGANVLGAMMAFPQAWRLWRFGRADGVSPVWAGVSVVSNLWWIAYAVGLARWVILPVAVASVLGYAAVLAGLRRFGAVAVSDWAPAALLVALVPLLAVLAGGWVVAGITLGLLYGVQLAPAVVAAWRSNDLGGVSVGTWLLGGIEALLWGWYGARVPDPGVVALGVVGVAMSSLVLLRVRRWVRTLDAPGRLAISTR